MIGNIIEFFIGEMPKEQRMKILTFVWKGWVTCSLCWILGLAGTIGLVAPFARANEVDKISKTVVQVAENLREARLDRIDERIQNVRAQQCRTAIDSPPRKNYTDQLNDLYAQYVTLSGGKAPRVPRCDET